MTFNLLSILICSHLSLLFPPLPNTHTGLTIVTIEQTPEILFETQTVTLTCVMDGAGPDTNYTWLRDEGVLTGIQSNVMLLGNQLSISNVSIAEWDGVCIACLTTMGGSGSINLTVMSKFLWKIILSTIENFLPQYNKQF